MTEKPSYEELEQRVRVLEAAVAERPEADSAIERLFNLSLDLLCVADFNGYFRIINAAFENTLGYDRQTLLRTPFIEFVHPDDTAATHSAMQQLITGEKVTYFENRYRCSDGSEKWLAWTAVPVIEEGFVYAVARDISEQKAVQNELATQRDLFNNVLSNVPASIFWKDRHSVYLGANERFAREAGLESPLDLVGKTDYDMAWTKEQSDFYRQCDRMVMDSGAAMLNIEESQLQADGKRIEILTNKVPLLDSSGQVSGMLGIYMDITKLKQTETTLRKSESRLKTLFDSAAEFIFVIDPVGTIINVNKHACDQSGYDNQEIIGKNIKEFFTPDSQNICDCNFPRLREQGYNRADIEFVCKDRRTIQMECSATAVPDDKGDFTSFLIIQRDVTERKRAAAALANSERRFRAIFNSTYQLIGVLDPDGMLLQVNQTALDFGGLRSEDVVGCPFWDTGWWRYSADVQHRLRSAVMAAAQGAPVRYEEELLSKDDSIRTIDFTLKPVKNQHGETALIISEGRDITEYKRAEAEIQHHRQEIAHVIRLSTMGEMASGMAHELNQPLAALVSYCGTAISLAKALPGQARDLCGILERAAEQAHRAGEIIRHLREFVSKENDEKQALELDRLIDDLNVLLGPELKNANVRLENHLECRGCRIMANKVQIEQVLVNLVRNSLEALQSMSKTDGRVLLKTQQLDNETIEVTVTDNGPGIEAGIVGQMFDPFQTSKASGMGMGLSISRSIIEAHGGRIWADAQYRGGALLAFTLPVCR